MKKYLEVKKNDYGTTHLKLEVYYSLGGYNYFTYGKESRGYYASVTPVERKERSECYTWFTGVKQLVNEVSRRSAKAEAEAEKLAENVFPQLVDYVLSKQGLELSIKVAERESVETIA